ncbi:amino acid permease 3-like isoform X2 [Jatropha curcas]|uniref:amino acid permease 3-like isoform X2 n=1 Tax=Jatropha curcas TaxID=180498 RepID=UPI001893BC93|nr:amino acid permease 3-like isoform X2 [Jatropha curcas]
MAVQNSMELASSSCDDDGHPSRTGNLWSCVAHIITAVIGSGVLSLAWSTAQLGWIAGPIALLCFAIVTYISAFLLSDCYRSPDPVTGTRNYCYMDAVRVNLGKTQTWFCGLLQYLSMYGTCVAYVITTSTNYFNQHESNSKVKLLSQRRA